MGNSSKTSRMMNNSAPDSMEYSEKDLLTYFEENGIINNSSIQEAILAKKRDIVLKVHPYKITQGMGRDRRWFTYVEDKKAPGKRRKVGRQTEEAIIDYLYKHYALARSCKKNVRLPDCYDEWLRYKLAVANRASTVKRIDTDYKRFYRNEPLSKKIIETPLRLLTKADIEMWSYSLIKEYDLTHKRYSNLITILRQVYEYLIDREILEVNPVNKVKIRSNAFHKVRKKPANTQIFFHDEVAAITEAAYAHARESLDENYLAIPMFFQTGIRIGECLGLSFTDFDKEAGTVLIHCSMLAKEELLPDGTWATRRYEVMDYLKGNADERLVLVPDSCFKLLTEIRKIKMRRGRIGNRLFEARTPSEVQLKLLRLCKELGIAQRSPHKIRKTYISTLLNKGFDLDFVREQAGHQDLKLP